MDGLFRIDAAVGQVLHILPASHLGSLAAPSTGSSAVLLLALCCS